MSGDISLSSGGTRKDLRRPAFYRARIGKSLTLIQEEGQEIPEGSVLGNYRFIELVGKGGFGEVYRARSLEVHRDVAVKLYKIEDKGAFAAFRRGANFLAQLDHLNIVKMFDFFTVDCYALMVMELLAPDQTLRCLVGDFCSQDRIAAFIQTFSKILAAVRYCHQIEFVDVDGDLKLGIYHGDIKPDNIFVHKGEIKIADFMIPNLEQFILQRKRYEIFPLHATDLYGTPMYMSPEQRGGIVNEQTDIYNIGVTAFELLTGFYPYDTVDHYHASIPQHPSRYCPHSPNWLNAILMKCIANDRAARYSHIAEIERDILSNLSGGTLRDDTLLADESRLGIYRDSYFLYQAGLHQLLDLLGPDHSSYDQVLVYQQRLSENISKARQNGDNPLLSSERAEIIRRLNGLAKAALGISFNELCGL